MATVAGGSVTAVSAGSATITAKAGEKSASCAVTVRTPAPVTYSISGAVKNGNTGVKGITVQLLNETGDNVVKTAVSDENGAYTISGVSAGTYQLGTAATSAYQATTATEVTVSGNVTDKALDVTARGTNTIKAGPLADKDNTVTNLYTSYTVEMDTPGADAHATIKITATDLKKHRCV